MSPVWLAETPASVTRQWRISVYGLVGKEDSELVSEHVVTMEPFEVQKHLEETRASSRWILARVTATPVSGIGPPSAPLGYEIRGQGVAPLKSDLGAVEWLAETVETYLPTGTLDDLVPSVRPEFDALVAQATAWGMSPHVRSVGRTCAQQAEQFKLGYSHADLCRGMHVLGHAADLDLSPNTCATYTKLGAWWEGRGGVWGGRWSQFGACGDAGHFHYGFGGAQAVPTSVCPSGVSLAECARIREDYLDAVNTGAGVSRGSGLLAGALIIAAGVGLVWAVTNVKSGALVGVRF